MRLIDADALLEALQNQCTSLDISYKVFQILDNAPTIQRDGWILAYTFNPNHIDMVLPSGWYRTRDEAINVANTPSYKGTTIKIVCVDFEVAE